MHFFISLATLLLSAVLANATPLAYTGPRGHEGITKSYPGGGYHGACLNQTGINTLVDGYTYLLEHPGGPAFNTTANTILSATNFTVQSDSILTLSGRPVRLPSHLTSPSCPSCMNLPSTPPPLNIVPQFPLCHPSHLLCFAWEPQKAF